MAVDAIIKSEMAGNPRHELVLDLGDTPEYLIQHANFQPRQMVIKGSTISKACFDHGLRTSFLKRLPEVLNKPKSLFKSVAGDASGSVVVVTFEFHSNIIPIIIPIRPDCRVGRSALYNQVVSIYGKDGESPEAKWKRQGALLWEQK